MPNGVRWLYVSRGCAVFHDPKRNQRHICSSVPTSHGFRPLANRTIEAFKSSTLGEKNPFVEIFAKVATIDTSPYICVPEALRFREEVCGGEESIRQYCRYISLTGAQHVAEILGTQVMDNKTSSLTSCCFANVRLPLAFTPQNSSQEGSKLGRNIHVDEAPKIAKWITERTVFDYDTIVPAKCHAGAM